jgi:hypothetical protein
MIPLHENSLNPIRRPESIDDQCIRRLQIKFRPKRLSISTARFAVVQMEESDRVIRHHHSLLVWRHSRHLRFQNFQ